jgi:hypothetical protein
MGRLLPGDVCRLRAHAFAILTGLWHIITYFNQATAALIRRGAIERRAI